MKLRRVLVLAVAMVILNGVANAQQDEPKRSRDAELAVDNMGMKFVRGLTNAATGWCELLPRQFIRSYEEDGPALCFPYGLMRGTFMTIARTGAGVFEMLTCYVPIDDSYSCIIDPAYVWQEGPKDEDKTKEFAYTSK